jgi:hypothetical protein
MADCPIPSTHDKLNEAQYFFDGLLKNYHRPYEFQFNLNAFIQAIRNITFMLQSEEQKPDVFDNWYAKKQEDMKTNETLRRFVNARNVVVKRSSLTAKSKARSGMFRGRRLKLVFMHDLPVLMDTYEALEKEKQLTIGLLLDEEHLSIGEQVGVERTWIVTELGDGEAATTCLEALNYMGQLVAEAHALFGLHEKHTPIVVDMPEVQVLLETMSIRRWRRSGDGRDTRGPARRERGRPEDGRVFSRSPLQAASAANRLSVRIRVYRLQPIVVQRYTFRHDE